MKIKSIYRTTLFWICLFSLPAISSSADFTLTLTPGKSVVQGDEVTLPVLATAQGADRNIAGAAFTVLFDGDQFNFIEATSTFFPTFAAQQIEPATVTVGQQTYTQPIVTDSTTPGTVMIAAARAVPESIPANTTIALFNLKFEAKQEALVSDHSISLLPSIIRNVAAGYPQEGAEIAALIGLDTEIPITDEGAFPEYAVDFGQTLVAVLSYAEADNDEDGADNQTELANGTDPEKADTDGDGRKDGDEIHGVEGFFTNPLDQDTDGDGALDGHEVLAGTNPEDDTSLPQLELYTQKIAINHEWSTYSFAAHGQFAAPVIIARPVTSAELDVSLLQIRNINTAEGTFEARLRDSSDENPAHASENVDVLILESGSYKLSNGKNCFATTHVTKPFTKAGISQKVKFPARFFKSTPVVLASVTSANDEDSPVNARAHAVSKTGFSLLLQEEQYQQKYDPQHPAETVSYVAFEKMLDIVGDYVVEIRKDLRAVTHASEPGQPSATIESFLPTTATPSFLAQTQSVYDKDPVTLRVTEVSPEGAEVYLVEDTSLDELKTTHKAENLGVMFLSPVTTDDSDEDGLHDLEEYFIWKTDPNLADSDGDKLLDGEEIVDGAMVTDPNKADSDGDLVSDGNEVFNGSDPNDGKSTPDFKYLVDKVVVGHTWKNVTFPGDKQFFDPVVVAKPATMVEAAPLFIQIAEISSTGFKVRLRETSEGDGIHAEEVVHYIVSEKGYFTLDDGTRLIAGKQTSKAQNRKGVKQKVTFKVPRNKRLRRTPAVFASIGATTPIDDQITPAEIRVDRPNKVGFTYLIQEEQAQEKNDPAHQEEEFCFLAFEPFTGIIGNTVFDIGLQSKAVTHQESEIQSELSAATSATPGFIASMQTLLDKDPATLRVLSIDNDGALIRVVEDQSLDALKLEHRAETIAHLFFTPVNLDDGDEDGLSNLAEYFTHGTDLNNSDHDNDGLLDGDEIANNTDPTKADSDGDGFSDGHEVNFADTNPLDNSDQPGLFLHIGSVNNVTEQTQTIPFGLDEHSDPIVFWDPVVVARPASFNESDATFIQLSNITKTHFDIRLVDTGDAADEQHQPEMVHFLVIDRGYYAVPSGERIFAGKFETRAQTRANRFERFTFLSRFFRTTPVVLGSLNSVEDSEPARVRLERISKTGVYASLQEDSFNQKKSPGHPSETVSIIAWEPFTGIESGVVFEVDKRSKGGTTEFKDLEFNRIHSAPPFFLANMQTAYDKDSSNLRFLNLENDKVSLLVQEDDAIGDGKINHTRAETIGYFAISAVDEDDTDGDGLGNDFEELVYHTDQNSFDTDGDGLSDGDEVNTYLTDPLVKDSDDDGAGDGHEVGAGTNPLLAAESPDPFIKIVEVRTSLNAANDWIEIDTAGFYDPVVVASSASADRQQLDVNGNPEVLSDFISTIIQMRKKANGNFEIRSAPTSVMGANVEPLEQRTHVAIMERGSYTTPEGNVILADTSTYQQKRKNIFKRVKFPRTPVIKRTAVMFASVSSAKDEMNPIYHRLNNVSRTGFYYTFQEEESSDQIHVIRDEEDVVLDEGEQLSYIVFGGSKKIITGGMDTEINGVPAKLDYDAQILVKKVDDELIYTLPRQVDDTGSILQGFLMDLQKTYDRDPANLRYTESWDHGVDPESSPPSTYYPFVAEDQSKNMETSHNKETLGLLRFTSPAP